MKTPTTTRRRAATVSNTTLDRGLPLPTAPANRARAFTLARRHISAVGTTPDEEGRYHEAIERIAATLRGDLIRSAETALDRLDTAAALTWRSVDTGLPVPSDVACDRWTPAIEAALFLGFAMGAADAAAHAALK